jgi:dUTP pyrophosphatase
MELKVKLLSRTAKLPTKSHKGDLGYDLYCAQPVSIYPGETKLLQTDIAIEFPAGWGGIVKDRSSVATRRQVFTVAGVIDNGYTGPIQIALFNASEHVQAFAPGDKVAQMVMMLTTNFPVIKVDEITSEDGRNENGFGSTGN